MVFICCGDRAPGACCHSCGQLQMLPGQRERSGAGAHSTGPATSLCSHAGRGSPGKPLVAHGTHFSTFRGAVTLPLPARPPVLPSSQPSTIRAGSEEGTASCSPTCTTTQLFHHTTGACLVECVLTAPMHPQQMVKLRLEPVSDIRRQSYLLQRSAPGGSLQAACSPALPDCAQAALSKGDR